MSKVLKYCPIGLLFLVSIFVSCKKELVQPHSESEVPGAPPPPSCFAGQCNITNTNNVNGDDYFNWLVFNSNSSEGDLYHELTGQAGISGITYDLNNNPLTCSGFYATACFSRNYSSVFSYNNDGSIKTINVDHTFKSFCPLANGYFDNIHTGIKIDFVHTFRVVNVGGIPVLFPLTTATLYKSDTVQLGQSFNTFTPTGRTYSFEYGLSGDKLKFKRYKADAASTLKEYTYTYDASGHVTRVSISEGGIEKFRINATAFDTKKSFASNKIMQLLTATYGTNNPTAWNNINFVNLNTNNFTASYLYNFYCYPVTAHVTFNGMLQQPGFQLSYTCKN